jgi:hypothetical protein
MRESETFDAFYVRTVSQVTSRMHEFAGGDPQADHAIREAYARAYQQWYEVSGYRDPERWVFDVARDAFERRRAQGVPASAEPAPDTGTWPGMYREPAAPRPVGPESTLAHPGDARPGGPAARSAAGGFVPAGAGPVGPLPGGVFGSAGPAASLAADSPADPFGPGQYQPGTQAYRPAPPGGPAGLGLRGTNTKLLAAAGAAVVLIGALAYFAFSSHGGGTPSAQTRTPAVKTAAKPRVTMLGPGLVGSRGSVPWSLIGAGWALADVSTAQPGTAGGSVTTYLVDPEGGRYRIRTWPAGSTATLLAWSGDRANALYGTTGTGAVSYTVLSVRSGTVTPLRLPAGVTVTGFTRPDGINLLAVQQGPLRYKLERYNLAGVYQATLATMVRKPTQPAWTGSCGSECGAISSPDGDEAVWGVQGNEMQLVSNAGGLIHKLHVPDSGTPPTCTPLGWWDSDSVLASCAAVAPGSVATRLWVVPDGGGAARPLSVASGTAAGIGYDLGAWRAGDQAFTAQTTATECSSAASGPGGLEILKLTASGAGVPTSIPGSTGNHNAIVGSADGRLLVLAQTSCPGTSSLFWFNPSTGASKPLLAPSGNEAGVLDAVAYSSD